MISVAEWHQELLGAGFTGTDIVRYDQDPPYNTNAYIVSRRPKTTVPLGKEISFLHSGTISGWARTLEETLITKGINVQWLTLDDPPSTAMDVISLIELDYPFFNNLSDQNFHALKSFIPRIKGHCLWLMRPVQLNDKDPDPRYALALGFMRAARKEAVAKFATLELNQDDTCATASVIQVFDKIRDHRHENPIEEDYEFVLQDGLIHVGRFHYNYLNDIMAVGGGFESRSLDIGCFGMFDSLTWTLDGRVNPLGQGDVEVDIRFVGLNFRVSLYNKRPADLLNTYSFRT